ncbi:MAG: hypothetical protein AB3N17_07385, partial [Tateyamaria sp.]
MKTQTRCVVIGGGLAGCSTVYHITQAGWTGGALGVRDRMTKGTTWPSAAPGTQFGMNQPMEGLKTPS